MGESNGTAFMKAWALAVVKCITDDKQKMVWLVRTNSKNCMTNFLELPVFLKRQYFPLQEHQTHP